MATAAPFLSPFLVHHSLLYPSAGLLSLTAAKLGPLTPPFLKTLAAKSTLSSAMLYRLLLSSVRNTRITPVATYLAYKSSGYADTGAISGVTISDFVSVWTPYNTGSGSGSGSRSGMGRKGRRGEEGKGMVKGKDKAKAKALVQDVKEGLTMGGTREETGLVVLEKEGRESRPARQSVKFEARRRHFCRQLGCEKSAL
ncbi:hypothetical protein CAC42_93 [Sphaceloma murrayae]|uniref:Uncharacterized protein n=1 Tax=Sphaceloma murrayae TaxID=2082308 RepID=A0A2K1QP18_9PEZI|nr:hypothetical protein CAC42_93 [Sphaceloma murrayae]